VLALACLLLAALAWWTWRAIGPGGDAARVAREDTSESSGDARLLGRKTPAEEEADATRATAPSSPERPDGPQGTITGRILGPDGKPVPGAEAVLLGSRGLYGGLDVQARATTDADGRFTVVVRAGRPVNLAAIAPGCCAAAGPGFGLAPDETRDVGTLHLETENTIRVRVVDEDGGPAAGVELSIESEADPVPEGWEVLHIASGGFGGDATGADGRSRFRSLPAGTYRIFLFYESDFVWNQVRERVPADGREVVFVVPARVAPQTVRLLLRLEGPNGEDVPAARVELRSTSGTASGGRRADGLFAVTVEEQPGPFTLLVWDARDAVGVPLGYRPFVLRDVHTREEPLLVRMEPGLDVRGCVTAGGEPATRTVSAWTCIRGDGTATRDPSETQHLESVSWQTTTDTSGAFVLTGLPKGTVELGVRGEGRLEDAPVRVETPASDVVLELVPTAVLRVRVHAPADEPFGVAGLRVYECVGGGLHRVYALEGGEHVDPYVRVFEVAPLRPEARYRVAGSGRTLKRRWPETILDGLVPREEPYDLLLAAGPAIEGRVEREDGTPVWGALVYPRPWPGGEFGPFRVVDGRWYVHATTDEDGQFHLEGLEAGDYLLVAQSPGLTSLYRDVRASPGTTGHRLVVHGDWRICGHVVDLEQGALDGIRVAAVPETGPTHLWAAHHVGEDGSFETDGLAPGRYRLSAWNDYDGRDPRCARSAVLEAGARDVRLTLRAGACLEVCVKDAHGRVVPGALVGAVDRWTSRRERTGREGTCAFGGLVPGSWTVEVDSPLGPRAEREVELEAGEARIEVVLPAR